MADPRRLLRLGLALALGLASGCSSSSPSSPTSSPSSAPTLSAAPSAAASAWPLKDMSARPQLWFGPLDPWSWDRFDPGSGPHQFYDLFNADAAWSQVSDAVQVFGLNSNWIETFGSEAQLRQVVEDLGRRGIGLWTEAGQLTETSSCNASNLEGFSGAPPARAAAERLRAAGGTLYTFKLEHGFDAATFYDLQCRMSPAAIAEDTVKTVEAVRGVFPGVVIGSVETANLDAQAVSTWLEAYREAVGEELGYFHLDVNFTIADWAVRARAIEDVVHSRGIDFGIIYAGDESDATDAAWLDHAEARAVEYEVITGGHPDHVVFQSWHRHPESLLPETGPETFTNLVSRYLRPRTALSLVPGDASAGGTLTMADGSPVPGATIEVSARPLSGPGAMGTYTIDGVVPDGAGEADVGLRVNAECDCSGPVELVLDGVRYGEGSESGNRVPNGDFAAGWDGWGVSGAGQAQVHGSGPAAALHVSATASQDVVLNSGLLPVTPGADFHVQFTAQVGPASTGHGYFDIVFLGQAGEVGRYRVDLAPIDVQIGGPETDASGRFEVALDSLPAGSFDVRAWYPGDDARWPAYAAFTR